MKELIRELSIQQAREILLSKHGERFKEYVSGDVFKNQVIAYTEEMDWSIVEFTDHIAKINGLS